jgi:hypothetical protein
MLAQPEALRERHLHLIFPVVAAFFVLRTSHREVARRDPEEGHVEPVVCSRLTGAGTGECVGLAALQLVLCRSGPEADEADRNDQAKTSDHDSRSSGHGFSPGDCVFEKAKFHYVAVYAIRSRLV